MRGFGSTLGLFVPGRGFLYRMPLAPKATASLACALAVVVWRTPLVAVIALAIAIGALTVGARIPPARIVRMLAPAAPVLVILAVYQGITQGWVRAFAVVGGITACLLAARAVTLTTPVQVLLDGVARLARPFRRVGADPERFALALSIMLRSIPYLAGMFVDIRDAARARWLQRSMRVAVTPLVVGAVAYAQRTGEALAARGLGEHDDGARDGAGDGVGVGGAAGDNARGDAGTSATEPS
ncbi:energy-coupling factor transporter transmembrane protein EcfT [Arthrobacter agilis]|uniref:energy-coupling factor transporter transmembrane component T family protein n=1 Tax=Arthrobacter agilis TaxID=37921 RepID=UPI000B3531DA|nr:energy-coupling factor transporter transmembrane protein EcfT [Arthrobacter agilis]OUM44515.1 hypothetical protein B8W74_03385 [Arthrobacter agilis]PPB47420.1 energy-coupling factor transporter transmembrane protein EcfT [Arthrobacter agilis]TPV22788.1 energy-coupling factor transporter transmembrane protein EcfT [Arthrobacter agilis]VDR32037.1 Energy-coupling factor transporter transmembrane protein BioN [Arthrobacter agilis]